MEFGAKEILIGLGILVLIAIVLDFVKRMRASKYENIRMSRRKQPIFDDDDNCDDYGSELPSGGGRVVAYRNAEDGDELPVETADDTEQQATTAEAAAQPVASEPVIEPEPVQKEPAQVSMDLGAESTGDASDSPVAVLHLMAQPEQPFDGLQLREALLSAGLRYGSMKIFHRHQQVNGSGPVLFSVANSVNPGIFDLNHMDELNSPGVTLFFSFDDVNNPLQVFDLMFDTAKHLNTQLGGELKDETRSAMTRQTVEHYRQKIADYERTKLAGAR